MGFCSRTPGSRRNGGTRTYPNATMQERAPHASTSSSSMAALAAEKSSRWWAGPEAATECQDRCGPTSRSCAMTQRRASIKSSGIRPFPHARKSTVSTRPSGYATPSLVRHTTDPSGMERRYCSATDMLRWFRCAFSMTTLPWWESLFRMVVYCNPALRHCIIMLWQNLAIIGSVLPY